MALFEKKDKLLFSFATNTVKMCGFVEPAQRNDVVCPVSVTVFVRFDEKSTGNSVANLLILLKGF